jgi:hypothetical protein
VNLRQNLAGPFGFSQKTLFSDHYYRLAYQLSI